MTGSSLGNGMRLLGFSVLSVPLFGAVYRISRQIFGTKPNHGFRFKFEPVAEGWFKLDIVEYRVSLKTWQRAHNNINGLTTKSCYF